MSVEKSPRRARGRPRGFAPDAALDCAAELFWRHGYEGTDVEAVASRVGVTKPSLYRLFGDKEGLFVQALAHYGRTHGSDPVRAFVAASKVREAVARFLETAVAGATRPGGPSGCLMACVAAQCSEALPQVRALYAAGLDATEKVIVERFAQAVVLICVEI